MPRRNLFVLVAVTLVALLCYQRVQKNPYGRVLANAMTTIENRYLEPIQASELFEGAMDGMIGKLDDYSAYITPADLQEFHETIDLEFGGVGMEVALDPQTKQLMVLSPLVGSPAYKAGIRAGDKILRIGERQHPRNVAARRRRPAARQARRPRHAHRSARGRGKAGGDQDRPRQRSKSTTVLGDTRNADGSWNFFLEGHDRIGYVRITSFTDKTADELEEALEWLSAHDMRGLVLDLRDDPGGYLDAAVDVCDLLIDSGVIVTTRRRDGRISRTYAASGKGPFTDFPMAVLVNQQSASAAEIVAACLQDHHRAAIVGQRTYGKGTIQEVIRSGKGLRGDEADHRQLLASQRQEHPSAAQRRRQGRLGRIARRGLQGGAQRRGAEPLAGVARPPRRGPIGRQERRRPEDDGRDRPTLRRPPALRAVEYVEKEAAGKQ